MMMSTRHGYLIAVIFVLAFELAFSDHWSEWSAWSQCSRSCDRGVSTRQRRCLQSGRLNECHGDRVLYAICNLQACPGVYKDYRGEQCSAHDRDLFWGIYHQWIPHHDNRAPCSLFCRSANRNVVHMFAKKVLDGTSCRPESDNICVRGRCWSVGCDGIVGSTLAVDSCGICGGNNSCNAERFRWLNLGFGVCSTTCGVGVQETRMVCQDAETGRVVDDKPCMTIPVPKPEQRDCINIKCPPRWRVGIWGPCTQTCGGGISWRKVICVDKLLDGTERVIADEGCEETKPSNQKSCNNFFCPKWYAGNWAPCSVSCGIGTQHREVVCRFEGDVYCDENIRPVQSKNCTSIIPCLEKHDGSKFAEFRSGDVLEIRQIEPDDNLVFGHDVIYEENIDISRISSPRYVVSKWGPCSSTCGHGTRFRYVRCKVYLPYLRELVDISASDCKEKRPIENEQCYSGPCPEHYQWETSGYTDCSKTCLGGIQETLLVCVNKYNASIVDNSMCSEAPTVPIDRRICNDIPCPQRWLAENFSECSTHCGGGVRSREVRCIQEFAPGLGMTLHLPDFMCRLPMPEREEPCNNFDCPASWAVSDWSKCSVTCGKGFETRIIFCKKILSGGEKVNVNHTECSLMPQPVRYQPCERDNCPSPKLRQTKVRFFQLNKIKKVRLSVGMKAAVLPGTTLIIKCPTKGMDRRLLRWFKDGLPVRWSNRVKRTFKHSLRIHKSMPEVDSGIYTCKAGRLQGTISIKFSTIFDVFQWTVLRESYLSGFLSKPVDDKITATKRDPIDRKNRYLHVMESQWSTCSTTCDGGLQSRNVSCEIITSDYFIVYPLKACRKSYKDKKEPLTIQSCNVMPCSKWNIGNWSRCGDGNCLRNRYSEQNRSVECVSESTREVINETFCYKYGKIPETFRECFDVNCTARWNVTEWSQCEGSCGSNGTRTREVTCLWMESGLPASRHCDFLPKPHTEKTCKMAKCKKACEDESGYCSIIRLMRFCGRADWKTRCCFTCSDY